MKKIKNKKIIATIVALAGVISISSVGGIGYGEIYASEKSEEQISESFFTDSSSENTGMDTYSAEMPSYGEIQYTDIEAEGANETEADEYDDEFVDEKAETPDRSDDTNTDDDHTVYPAKDTSKKDETTSDKDDAENEEKLSDGFNKIDEDWVYYQDGKVYNVKTDVVYGTIDGDAGWYYVEKGKAIDDYTGFAKNDSGWWYIEDGKVTFKHNSVTYGKVNGQNGWWNVKGSNVKFNESVESNEHGWWYIKNGKVDFNYTGFAKNDHGWWYVEKGNVSFKRNAVTYGKVDGQTGWWNVKGSNVKFNESVESNEHGWWYVKNGKVDFGYTGFAKNDHGWWYVEKGNVSFKRNAVTYGKVNGQTGWWNVKSSNVKFNESVESNEHGWWYVKNGKVDFNYTGFAKNAHGWWYVKKGNVNFKHNAVTHGKVNGETAWWNVKGSNVKFNESVESNEHGWWYIKNGKVDFKSTGWKNINGNSYYIKGGNAYTGWHYMGASEGKNPAVWSYFGNNGVQYKSRTFKEGKLTHTFNSSGNLTESKLTIMKVINQRTTAFGNSGCGGAAALMALQATGNQLNANYSTFWNTCPRAVRGDFRTGYVPGVGITNPAYVNWIKTYAPATRYSGIVASDVLPLIRNGQAVILLVPSGSTTHFVVAYGYNYDSGKYLIADPWGNSYSAFGVTYSLTPAQVNYRLNVAAPRETGTREGIAVGQKIR